eukprot:Rmarinus@m.18222
MSPASAGRRDCVEACVSVSPWENAASLIERIEEAKELLTVVTESSYLLFHEKYEEDYSNERYEGEKIGEIRDANVLYYVYLSKHEQLVFVFSVSLFCHVQS